MSNNITVGEMPCDKLSALAGEMDRNARWNKEVAAKYPNHKDSPLQREVGEWQEDCASQLRLMVSKFDSELSVRHKEVIDSVRG